ncbi:MAG: prepilin peptidase, partial [Verrucomicrobiae bacterium]|nr:prepilin peptidase [Verrucomicrobiae bacterium]
MTWLDWYLTAIVFAFGAVVGSFLNVCIHRLPRGRSIVSPPSHCPKCKQPIRWSDNIPIVSYVLLSGRCRHCHEPISPRYVIVEALTAVFFVTIWWRETGWMVPIYWLFIAGLIVATFIDFEHYIIPDEITLGGCAAGVVLATV